MRRTRHTSRSERTAHTRRSEHLDSRGRDAALGRARRIPAQGDFAGARQAVRVQSQHSMGAALAERPRRFCSTARLESACRASVPRRRSGKEFSPTSSAATTRPNPTRCAWSSSSSCGQRECTTCGGRRLKPESLAVTVAGRNIGEIVEMPITRRSVSSRASRFARTGSLVSIAEIAGPILKEVRERLRFLNDVGLEYLTLGRVGRIALRRRGAAHSSRDTDRLASRRRAVHSR